MTTYYEVWDDETGNRVGGSYATEAEARALLSDVFRVNGADAVRAMAILAFRRNSQGRYEPETVLEGADLIATTPTAEVRA
jgi:hypothetical protein